MSPSGYLRMGFEHLLGRRRSSALRAGSRAAAARAGAGCLARVTGFTLGHSVTLSLAALGSCSVPSALVEVGIAASLFWLATRLARGTGSDASGLAHPCGCAAALRPAPRPRLRGRARAGGAAGRRDPARALRLQSRDRARPARAARGAARAARRAARRGARAPRAGSRARPPTRSAPLAAGSSTSARRRLL